MRKKLFIYGMGFISITTVLIVSGIAINHVNSHDNITTTYVDADNEFNYDEEFESEIKYKTKYAGEVFDKTEKISLDIIKASYYVATIKDKDELGTIMIQITASPEKFPDGNVTYYYKNVFEEENKVYSSTYIYQTDEFLNNTGYRITRATALDEILYEDENIKETYTKKELHDILINLRTNNKKLSDGNAIVKTYLH